MYLAAIGYLYLYQNSLLYHPSQELFEKCELGEQVKQSKLLRYYRVKWTDDIKNRIVFLRGELPIGLVRDIDWTESTAAFQG